jgi:hypothetical protein
MTSLKAWISCALVLSFLAGGGAGVVADRLWQRGETAPPRDVDGYLDHFDHEIGFESEQQREAVRSDMEQYWTDLQVLGARLAAEHAEEVQAVWRTFLRRVAQRLGERQKARWRELTGERELSVPDDAPGSGGAGGK